MYYDMMLGPIGLDEERSVEVAVAVDRNDKHSFYALQWAVHVLLSKGQTLTLIHVHQTSLPSMHLSLSLRVGVDVFIWLFEFTHLLINGN